MPGEWFPFHDGIRPRVQVAHEESHPTGSATTMVPPKNCMCLRRRFCAYGALLARHPYLGSQHLLRRLTDVTGMALNRPRCHLGQSRERDVCSTSGVGRHPVPMFQDMQINDHAKYLGIMIGPGGHAHRWTAPRNIFSCVCAHSCFFPGLGTTACIIHNLRPLDSYLC